ncbi:HNH endonuclease [Herbaspirillum sp. BH-1]|uniref:HNH endonuclease n=1 Tax=Herbaspirillum sp. (strain BH-1) TaxID=2058884 RepID=UPI000C87FA8C|nr:HNH endonuclease signature motif containing protein [Herbaspirillum sp. BH-1]PLY57864.1 HNH endonuclease [Herbaspirillum sp. BH-1]
MTTLQDLTPTTRQRVRDIVNHLGIAMTTKYDWCFSNPGGPYLVNIWHDQMQEENGVIYFVDRASAWGEENRATATQTQLNRASAVSSLIQTAYYTKAPVNVAILDGTRKTVGLRETSQAKQRELDSVLWYPHHKEADGNIRVIRGKPQPDNFDPYDEEQPQQKQTAAPTPPNKVKGSGTAIFERDSEVVKAVKQRAANGCCEFCGQEGFKTASGGFYLEAHHVIPLNCGGPDDVRNVVAICADDHRRAHFGEDRHAVRDKMIWDVLAVHYPNDTEFFEAMDEKSLEIKRSASGQRKLEDHRMDN